MLFKLKSVLSDPNRFGGMRELSFFSRRFSGFELKKGVGSGNFGC